MADKINETQAMKESKALGIASPYRQALYITARVKMGYSPEKALEAARICDPKVVRRFESGK
jgi:hypothetical protein